MRRKGKQKKSKERKEGNGDRDGEEKLLPTFVFFVFLNIIPKIHHHTKFYTPLINYLSHKLFT